MNSIAPSSITMESPSEIARAKIIAHPADLIKSILIRAVLAIVSSSFSSWNLRDFRDGDEDILRLQREKRKNSRGVRWLTGSISGQFHSVPRQ